MKKWYDGKALKFKDASGYALKAVALLIWVVAAVLYVFALWFSREFSKATKELKKKREEKALWESQLKNSKKNTLN